ncbi:MAG: cytochrome c3 family protein [Thermodesulfobacteriota bacterium]
MKGKGLICFCLAAFLVAVFAAGLLVAADQPDTVKIYKTETFGKHTKGPVEFTHKKHVDEHKVACVECHHDAKYDGKTNNWKEGDPVQKCDECHKKNKEGKIDKLQNAFHNNCRGCHKKQGKGPEAKCNECHAEKQ